MMAGADRRLEPVVVMESVPAQPSAAARGPATVDVAGTSDRADWDAFVGNTPAAELYHDYRWRDLISRLFGHETLYLIARDLERKVCGVLPLVCLKSRIFGNFLVSLPYLNYAGALADSPEVERALAADAARRARALGVAHIELRHRDRSALDWPARDDKVTMLLELPQDEAALWKSFDGKLRSQIRRPEKEGGVARHGGADLLDDFYAVFARNMRDLGTPVLPRRFFEAVLLQFGEAAKIFVVDLGGRAVAAGFVLGHRDTLEIPWASSLREANRTGANMLLYWSVLRDAVARGYRRFDFGRSTQDSGTYRFKKQWGARPQQLRWHYWLARGDELPKLNPSNPKYRAAIALWRKLPVPVANWLGPHIVKNLP